MTVTTQVKYSKKEAISYLTKISNRCGSGKDKTIYGSVASIAIHNDGIDPSDIVIGGWGRAFLADIGITQPKNYGVIAVAQRLTKWLSDDIRSIS